MNQQLEIDQHLGRGQEECIDRTYDVEGEKYYINRKHYYNHYYRRYNDYYITDTNCHTYFIRDKEKAMSNKEIIYETSEYKGSYIEDSRIGRAYWYYPYCTTYSCYGNYMYNKPNDY